MPYRFTGKFTDFNTGLTQMDARWYNPHTARFLQPDHWNLRNTHLPVEIQHELMQFAGLNTQQLLVDPSQQMAYGYVRGNPLSYVDPMGLCDESFVSRGLDYVQTGLSVVGMAPGYGEPADLVNAGISTLRGNYVEAGLDLASAAGPIPAGLVARTALGVADDVVDAGKVVTKGAGKRKYMDAIDDADGAHTVWKENNKGEITNHQTFEPNTNPNNPNKWVKGNRTDVSGKSEFNKATKQQVDTPHTHDSSVPGGIRPAEANELPKL